MSGGLWQSDAPGAERDLARFDTSVAHIARVYDYWLGGKDNYAADREAGDATVRGYPDMLSSVRANRAFLRRTVRYLAKEEGIRQFLDIGTGLPSADTTRMRSPRRWRLSPGWFTSTMTRSSWRMRGRC